MNTSCQKRDKVAVWFLGLLLSQFCSVVSAAKKNVGHSASVATTASSEYGAFLKLVRAPSAQQQKAVESLFLRLKERHITIKPSLCKLLALAERDQLVPLCKKTALFFEKKCSSPRPIQQALY